MLKVILGALAGLILIQEARAQQDLPPPSCRTLNRKCVNDGFALLQKRLNEANQENQKLREELSKVKSRVDGNLEIYQVNRAVCLEWFSTGGPGAAFLPCDKNRIEQVFKLVPR